MREWMKYWLIPGQLLAEDLVQKIDDPRIALHRASPALLGGS
jgi:hypothetical protein